MSEITTIGLDLAKHVFQVHGVDADGATVVRKHPGLTTSYTVHAREGATLSAARARRSCSTAPRFDNGVDGSSRALALTFRAGLFILW
jgi:hypothetical protein